MSATGDRLIDAYYAQKVVTTAPTTTRAEVFATMAGRDVSALPIVDGGAVIGIVSLTDLLKNPGSKHEPIGEVMRKNVISVTPGTTLRDASRTMLTNNVHRLLVLDDRKLLGILAAYDVMRAIAQDRIETPLNAIMTSPVVTVDVLDPISFTLDVLTRSRLHGVVVTDRDRPAGVFTQVEALRAQTMPAMAPVEPYMSHSLLQLPRDTPAHRAASFAVAMRARRIVAMDRERIAGIATGIDLVRLVAQSM
jgi:CBS domain-containing protein